MAGQVVGKAASEAWKVFAMACDGQEVESGLVGFETQQAFVVCGQFPFLFVRGAQGGLDPGKGFASEEGTDLARFSRGYEIECQGWHRRAGWIGVPSGVEEWTTAGPARCDHHRIGGLDLHGFARRGGTDAEVIGGLLDSDGGAVRANAFPCRGHLKFVEVAGGPFELSVGFGKPDGKIPRSQGFDPDGVGEGAG